MRISLYLSVVVFALTANVSVATAQSEGAPLLFAIGVGAAVPLGADVSAVSKAGVHVDAGGYFEVYPRVFAGLHISYDIPTTEKLQIGVEPNAQFTGVTVRGMYRAEMGVMQVWGSVGFGLYRNRLSTCDANSCSTEEQSQAGMDLGVGLDVAVFRTLTVGPALGLTAPAFGAFSEQLLLNGGLRFTFAM